LFTRTVRDAMTYCSHVLSEMQWHIVHTFNLHLPLKNRAKANRLKRWRPAQGNYTPENDGYSAGAPKRQNNFTVKN